MKNHKTYTGEVKKIIDFDFDNNLKLIFKPTYLAKALALKKGYTKLISIIFFYLVALGGLYFFTYFHEFVKHQLSYIAIDKSTEHKIQLLFSISTF